MSNDRKDTMIEGSPPLIGGIRLVDDIRRQLLAALEGSGLPQYVFDELDGILVREEFRRGEREL